MPELEQSVITTDAQGRTSADYSGTISSRGINFPFPDPSQFSGFIPPEYTVNRIQWTNPAAYGGLNGLIEVSNGGVGNYMNLYHTAGTTGSNVRTAQLRMRSFISGLPDANEVQLEAIVQDAALSLYQKRKIIDAHGASDFAAKTALDTEVTARANLDTAASRKRGYGNPVANYYLSYYSPWAGYAAPYTPIVTKFDTGLVVINGLVHSSGAGAYATQYIATVPAPQQRIAVLTDASFGAFGYVGTRYDVDPGGVLIYMSASNSDGSVVAWLPINIAYYATN